MDAITTNFITHHAMTATFCISLIVTLGFLFSKTKLSYKLSLWATSLCIGLISGHITTLALPYLLLTLVMVYCYKTQANWLSKILSGFVLIILAIAFSCHYVPGFYNYLVFRHILISSNAYPFTLYLNFDNGIIGILLLLFFCPLSSSFRAFFKLFAKGLRPLLLCISTIAALSCATGFVQFEPKFPSWFLLWLINNLFFTCVLEEAFFRGFLQSQFLPLLFKKLPAAHTIAWILASFLFGLKHLPNGGIIYAALATFSGLGYGWVKRQTHSIEMAILTHFLLNTLHLLLFTYPGLVSP